MSAKEVVTTGYSSMPERCGMRSCLQCHCIHTHTPTLIQESISKNQVWDEIELPKEF